MSSHSHILLAENGIGITLNCPSGFSLLASGPVPIVDNKNDTESQILSLLSLNL